jgi:hypothetical protein
MSTQKTIFYSVSKTSDGCAYPVFFYDEVCAIAHQKLVGWGDSSKGWSAPCTGSFVITCSENDPHGRAIRGQQVIGIDKCRTREEYLEELTAALATFAGEDWTSKRHGLHVAIGTINAKVRKTTT